MSDPMPALEAQRADLATRADECRLAATALRRFVADGEAARDEEAGWLAASRHLDDRATERTRQLAAVQRALNPTWSPLAPDYFGTLPHGRPPMDGPVTVRVHTGGPEDTYTLTTVAGPMVLNVPWSLMPEIRHAVLRAVEDWQNDQDDDRLEVRLERSVAQSSAWVIWPD